MKMREKPFGLQMLSIVLLMNIAYLAAVWISPHTFNLIKLSPVPLEVKLWLAYFLELCRLGISSWIILTVLFGWQVFTLFGLWKMKRWAYRSLVYILVVMIVWGAVFPRIARAAFDSMCLPEQVAAYVPSASLAGFEAVSWLGRVVFLLWSLLFALWFVVLPACALYYMTEPRIRVYFGIPIFRDPKGFKRVSFVLYLALIIISALIVLPLASELLKQVFR